MLLPAAGTLGYWRLLAAELGLPSADGAASVVSTSHHASIGQRLLPLVLGRVNRRRLELTYSYRDALLAPVGAGIERLLPAVPGGSIIFFVSGVLMQKAISTWKENGTWARLAAAVGGEARLFVDASRSAGESTEIVRRYKAATEGSARAALLAVLRGRSSEGADFRDYTCRAVFVIGAAAGAPRWPRPETCRCLCWSPCAFCPPAYEHHRPPPGAQASRTCLSTSPRSR